MKTANSVSLNRVELEYNTNFIEIVALYSMVYERVSAGTVSKWVIFEGLTPHPRDYGERKTAIECSYNSESLYNPTEYIMSWVKAMCWINIVISSSAKLPLV